MDNSVRGCAATTLSFMGSEAKEAVPALIKALKIEDPWLRKNVLYTLGQIGPDAKEALPALNKLATSSTDNETRRSAKSAIVSIRRK